MDDMFATIFERERSGRDLTVWGLRAPLSDIEDKGDAILVSVEMPGMKKEDIKIIVGKDSVSINAERKEATEEKKKNYYYRERTYSGYRRSFALPAEVNPEDVEAEYKEGILRVTLKKIKRNNEKKEIEIK